MRFTWTSWNKSFLPSRVPHLHDGLIVDKVGHFRGSENPDTLPYAVAPSAPYLNSIKQPKPRESHLLHHVHRLQQNLIRHNLIRLFNETLFQPTSPRNPQLCVDVDDIDPSRPPAHGSRSAAHLRTPKIRIIHKKPTRTPRGQPVM